MPTPAQTISVADDPALLRIDGPIATITLNRPSAFNSIDLSIAKKLEQLSAAVEASDQVKVLVIEGEGRAFCAGGDLQTIGAAAAADTSAPGAVSNPAGRLRRPTTSRRSSANCSGIITPSSPRCGECPRSCCRAFTVRPPAPGCRSPLWLTCALPPKTPALLRPTPSLAYRPTAAAPLAWPRASAPGAPCKSFLPKTAFRQRKPMNGVLSRKSSRPPN